MRVSFPNVFQWALFGLTVIAFTLGPSTASAKNGPNHRSFRINYNRNTFSKDGQDFRYISGSFHYFRSLPGGWDDVFKKFRLAGLNAVQTYVEWSSHEPKPTEYTFEGNLNLFGFLELAQKNDLLVILRPGPFIDAERDMGGLPAWLLWQKPNIGLRTSDPEYIYFVSRWFDYLLPKLKPYLYENGGPVIMVQVENEYGSFGCDKNYTSFLRDLIRLHLGDKVVLFTTDGAGDSYVKCGFVPNVYPTVDFGPENLSAVNESFAIQRRYAPKGPLVNSEFYPGWLDHWEKPHSKRKASEVAEAVDSILSTGANLNIYMFYGGTSFGFGSGANTDGDTGFNACPTSYDYDAPLSEARDPTDKYFAIKEVISRYIPVPSESPTIHKKGYYGRIPMQAFSVVHDPRFLSSLQSNPVESLVPLSFEELKIASGFILYETTIELITSDPALLSAADLKDRAYVYADRTFIGTLSRTEGITSMPIYVRKGTVLSILVENQGRPCYGSHIGESKGLGKVSLGKATLLHWKMYPLGGLLNSNLLLRHARKFLRGPQKHRVPLRSSSTGSGTFYYGNFTFGTANSSEILDTFVRFDGWTKGQIWVNEFNLGRYWPVVGPQKTLYLPGSLLKPAPEQNTFIVFELENAPEDCRPSYLNTREGQNSDCFITLTDSHVINGDTPYTEDVDLEARMSRNLVD